MTSSKCSWLIPKKSSGKSSKSSSSQFLNVRPDCKLKVRLIGNPVKVVKIFSRDHKCAVLDNEQPGQHLKVKYPKELSDVNIRYAGWCIDREDNTMKILDMPASVAKTFGNRERLVGKKIASAVEGCDWVILTNGKKGKDVRYEAVYLEESPLSEEEKKMVEDHKSEKDGHFDLRKIFQSHSFEEAEEKLFGY